MKLFLTNLIRLCEVICRMKKSLTEYASSLSGSNIDIFEEIIKKKYRKFIKFFQLMKDYNDSISKLEYEFSDANTLSVNVKFKKSVKMDEKQELISSWKKSGYSVKYVLGDKKMKLDIVYPE